MKQSIFISFLVLFVMQIISTTSHAKCIIPSYNTKSNISNNILMNVYSQLIFLEGQRHENSFCLQRKYDLGKEFYTELIPQNENFNTWKQRITMNVIRAPILKIDEDIIPKGYPLKAMLKSAKRKCHIDCNGLCKIINFKEDNNTIELVQLCGKDYKNFHGKSGTISYYKLYQKNDDNFMLSYQQRLKPFNMTNLQISNNSLNEWNNTINQHIRFLSKDDNETLLYGDMVINRENIRKNDTTKVTTHILLGTKISRKHEL